MGMYNYVPKSRVEETIKDILSDYSIDGFDRVEVGSIAAVTDYLDETNLVTAWDVRTSDWPNMNGGEAFAAWVEDGYLFSYQWTYQY